MNFCMLLSRLKSGIIISVFVVAFLIVAFYLSVINFSIRREQKQILGRFDVAKTQVVEDSSGRINYINQDNYTGIKISKEYYFDLDDNGTEEKLLIKSYEIVMNKKNDFTNYGFVTDVLTKRDERYVGLLPQLYGYVLGAREVVLSHRNRDKILVIELKQGELDNFRIYRYTNGNLVRIATPDDESALYYGIMTRGEVNFKDLNEDGIKEMVIYSRLSPPEKKRNVDVYRISGLAAYKINAYQEEMPNFYW